MKDIRFYIEYENKRKKLNGTNCIAIFIEDSKHRSDLNYEGLAAIFYHDNSPVCLTGISREYLRKRCKRTSEEIARKVHPELFKRLE